MSTSASPAPERYHSVTPYLIVEDANALIEFIKATFNAEEPVRTTNPDGIIGHTEMKIGDSVVMLSQSRPGVTAHSAMLYVMVPDVDAAVVRAITAGAKVIRPVTDQEYGHRSGGVLDTNGNQWWIASPIV
jgi:uncharacterized glyoxalase superfamily protein PhnB